MTPPERPEDGQTVKGETSPAVSFCVSENRKLTVLTKRSEFLAVARGKRQGGGSMMVQARRRDDGDPTIRVGFTCSKKVGNAVARNRAKRRLREVARLVLLKQGKPGWDYVLIGRATQTAARPFDLLQSDLSDALRKLHSPRPKRPAKS
jgi:ribonuclease P protein component